MNSQGFLTIVVISTVLFVFWYWKGWGAASKGPTQLNLRAGDSEPLVIPPERLIATSGGGRTKSLNVIFNYNGHSWDAYEVLGVPAGSGIKDVTAAYQAALRKNKKESHVFLETAYKAILHHR
jgi:hypothetical protein